MSKKNKKGGKALRTGTWLECLGSFARAIPRS